MTTDAGVHEADCPRRRARRRLRLRRDARARRGRQRVLFRRRRRAAARRAADVRARPRDRRRLRGAVQVSAGAERGGAAPARLSVAARRPRRLRDLARHAVRDAGASVTGHLGALACRRSPSAASSSSPGHRVSSLEPARSVAVLDDGAELPYDLFLGVPRHRAPDVVLESGMAEDGYVPGGLRGRSRHGFRACTPVGDVATVGVPEGGRVLRGRRARRGRVARSRRLQGGEQPAGYDGTRFLLRRVRRGPRRPRRRRTSSRDRSRPARSRSRRASSSPRSSTSEPSRRARWFNG